jgi:hypothetical protein
MAVLHKIALGLLLATVAAVLFLASWELWNYRHLVDAPETRSALNAEDRARSLEERTELLSKRVGDMELLVLILLGTSGLYAIVFVASSYFSASSFARQADQTIGNIQDQIGLAMGDLRELQEETEQRVREMTAWPVVNVPGPILTDEPPGQPIEPEIASSQSGGPWDHQIAEIAARLPAVEAQQLSEQTRFQLVQDEYAVLCLELASGSSAGSSLAEVYLSFGRLYASCDIARSRFYLERALRMAPPDSALASEIHYQLACRYAASHDFPYAMRELAGAFEHQFKTLDEKLAGDIEEGGQLYELASTAPFDKAVNDLLLNMSIGIG